MTGPIDLTSEERMIVDRIGRRAQEIIVALSDPQITDELANKLCIEATANYSLVNSILQNKRRP